MNDDFWKFASKTKCQMQKLIELISMIKFLVNITSRKNNEKFAQSIDFVVLYICMIQNAPITEKSNKKLIK